MNGDGTTRQFHHLSSGIGLSTPRNHRDASNPRVPGSEAGAGPWKYATPTPISVPRNGTTPARSSGSNPYAGRMTDNLSAPKAQRNPNSARGNLTASRTVFDSTNPRSRPKQNHSLLKQSQYFAKNPHAFKPSDSSESRVTVLVSSDEDIGEPIDRDRNTSPDPIDGFTDEEPVSVRPKPLASSMSTRKQLDFQSGDRSKRGPPPDGESTVRLARKLQSGNHGQAEIITIDDDDVAEPPADAPVPIEDDLSDLTSIEATDDIPPSKPSSSSMDIRHTSPTLSKIQRNTVATQVERIEQAQTNTISISHAIPNTAKPRNPFESSSSHRKGKEVDFFSLPSSAVGGAKRHMKPKIGPSNSDYASQSTNFISSKKEAAKALTSSSVIHLPLDSWSRGNDIHDGDSGHWFVCDGEKIHIRRNAAASSKIVSYDIRLHIGAVIVTEPPCDYGFPIIVQIKTAGAPKKDKNLNMPKFDHGAHGRKGTILLSFKVDHANWQHGEPYRKLVDILRANIDKFKAVPGPEAQRIWSSSYSLEDDERPRSKRRNTSDADSVSKDYDSIGPSLSRSMSRTSLVDDDPPGPVTRRIPRRSTVNDAPSRTTRSTRRTQEEHTRDSPVVDPDELILVYPSSGQGAVNVTKGDIKRLEPGQYLNDTLIEFALKLWLNLFREDNPDVAEQVHVFSSFFYKKISVKDKKEGYQSVRKWTSKFDLFKKKYIIVPINEHLHWYLAIICNPEYVLQPPPPTPIKIVSSVQTRKRKRESEAMPDTEDTPAEPPQSDTREATPQRSRSASEVDETSVEALLTDSCNISQEQAELQLALAEKDELPENENGGLLYPSSEPDPMEVDVLPEETKMDEKPKMSLEAIEIDGTSSQVEENNDVDVEVVDDAPMEVDTTITDNTFSAAIPAARFYSSAYKGKARAVSPEVPHPDTIAQSMETQEPAEPEPSEADPNKTWIFTFDSLGSKHPAAIANLKNYLQLEAQDKKGLDPANTTPAEGKTALVPAQPNFCDCGVYLIHFVQAFMKDPKRATEIILRKKAKEYTMRDREQDWNAEEIASFREDLLVRTRSLSDHWKEEKAAKEEQRRRETTEAGPSATASEGAPESDDEIIVGEIISKSKANTAKGKGKAKAKAAAEEGETKADRLR